MYFDQRQLAASVLGLLIVASVCAALIFRHGSSRSSRKWSYVVLCASALLALASWTRFGEFHGLWIDSDYSETGPKRQKIERHEPFHFHEFFHYYIASKYFRELGYENLYDCTTLADKEISAEQNRPRRISGYIRNLNDVLTDKTYDEAIDHCTTTARPLFTDARWSSFKNDLRELQHLVPDNWWSEAVFDAGFNPPPSWVLVGSAFANVIPIRVGTAPTYLLSTSLDVLLLIACFLGLRSAFGKTTAVLAAFYFGASFISSYGWNGGAFLRFTWVAAVVFGLIATSRRRWELAGVCFAAATCDRLFPAGFAIGAMIPVAYGAIKSTADRKILLRFSGGFMATVVLLVAASSVVFGFSAWTIFFSRILRHGDIYYVMHIGLKKVLNYGDWVYNQDFNGHEGLVTFKNWNLHLRETWGELRFLVVCIQLAVLSAIGFGSIRRRPYEAALLCGVSIMFFFNLPANYYFVIVCLVPAFLFRAAATTTNPTRRMLEYIALTAFNVFWMCTLIASRLSNDAIIFDHYICLALLVFLAIWILVWAATPLKRTPATT